MIKGRGAQINPPNRFDKLEYDEQVYLEEGVQTMRTDYITVHPKTIVTEVKSPDIPLDYSMNPYQGCEHGCTYCYARESHAYWGYSAGVDFESKIMVKKDAAKLLDKKLKGKNWKAAPIFLSGNTDCYQPIEKEMGITRSLLEVLWKHRHPVSIITKNSLVLRDIDILSKMANHNLVHVAVSITTLKEDIRRSMEPRTATARQRLDTISKLSEAGIPVMAMIAPVIPGLTDAEILPLVKAVSEAGARKVSYTIVRLNGDVAKVFEDWVYKAFPDRADRVLNRIRDCRGGKLGERTIGKRMSGEGDFADVIKEQFRVAQKMYLKNKDMPKYNLDLYELSKPRQMGLFD